MKFCEYCVVMFVGLGLIVFISWFWSINKVPQVNAVKVMSERCQRFGGKLVETYEQGLICRGATKEFVYDPYRHEETDND